MINLSHVDNVKRFIKYVKLREGDAVAQSVQKKFFELQRAGKEIVDESDVLNSVVEELKPGLAKVWEIIGEKRIYGSLCLKERD